MSLYILETGPSTYIGGTYSNVAGYGLTDNRNAAIAFRSVKEAMAWCMEYGRDAAIINFDTDECVG